jgi:hypothetical protein
LAYETSTEEALKRIMADNNRKQNEALFLSGMLSADEYRRRTYLPGIMAPSVNPYGSNKVVEVVERQSIIDALDDLKEWALRTFERVKEIRESDERIISNLGDAMAEREEDDLANMFKWAARTDDDDGQPK